MKGNFFMVFKDLLFIKELTLTDLLILSTLIKYHNEDRMCYLTTKDFIYDCNRSRKAIEKSFKHLRDLKLIDIKKIDGRYVKMVRMGVLERKLGYNKGIQDKETEEVINALKSKWNKDLNINN